MEKALLVTIRFDSDRDEWKVEDLTKELEQLVNSCRVQIVDHVISRPDKPQATYLIGKGKAEEIADACYTSDIDTVIFSHDFSGTQQRNLEDVIGKKTIDRTQLILDIFAQHAKSPEGVMQVELAQLQYLLPRLTGKGIILSRLGGGIGTRGPGEQKLEVDRRRIRKRIDKLRDDLKHLMVHRATMRKKRKDEAIPIIALVGYTSAGKSTLLNTLTDSEQPTKDTLFTTLDPLSRVCQLSGGEKIVISDTVGFLHQLPHHLIEAFKATLEEVIEADLLIHVLDISHKMAEEHSKAVYEVLKELGADNKPIITVLNKIDLLEDKSWITSWEKNIASSVAISAKSKENIQALVKKIQEEFSSRLINLDLKIPINRMDLVDLFYRQGKVLKVEYHQKDIDIKVSLPKYSAYKLLKDKDIKQNV